SLAGLVRAGRAGNAGQSDAIGRRRVRTHDASGRAAPVRHGRYARKRRYAAYGDREGASLMTMPIAPAPSLATVQSLPVTIPNGATVSNVLALGTAQALGIEWPAAFDSASVSWQG